MVKNPLVYPPSRPSWITFRHASGWHADFSHYPVEMTFDIPFQNTPPTGQLRVYSTPTEEGALIVSNFTSPEVNPDCLSQEKLQAFFDGKLIPWLFCQPALFRDCPLIPLPLPTSKNAPGVAFSLFSRAPHEPRQLEGRAAVVGNTLYVWFYVASEQTFNAATCHRFLDSMHLPQLKNFHG